MIETAILHRVDDRSYDIYHRKLKFGYDSMSRVQCLTTRAHTFTPNADCYQKVNYAGQIDLGLGIGEFARYDVETDEDYGEMWDWYTVNLEGHCGPGRAQALAIAHDDCKYGNNRYVECDCCGTTITEEIDDHEDCMYDVCSPEGVDDAENMSYEWMGDEVYLKQTTRARKWPTTMEEVRELQRVAA